MRAGTAALLMAATLALAACGEEPPAGGALPPVDSTSPSIVSTPPTIGPLDPDATMQPLSMIAEPSIVELGQELLITFPGGRDRGVAYVLERETGDSWRPTHFLTATTEGYGLLEPSWVPVDAAEGYGVEDIGIGGEGPDRLVVPDDAEPGVHRICTANSAENICTPVEVVGVGQGPMPVEPDGGIGDGAGPPPTTARPSDGPMPLGESAGVFYDVGHSLVADLIGLPVDDFERAAADRGYGPIRVVWSDGEYLDSTDDLVLGRVNVAAEGRGAAVPIVVDAYVETDPETGAVGEATIVDVFDGVEYYPACGNETLDHDGITWHQVNQGEYPDLYARVVNATRENLPESVGVSGFAARVVSPGPGDDIGTLVVWSDDVAYFVSDSGDLRAWLVTEELTYDWVC